VDKRLRADLRKMGDFKRVHPMPASSSDVPDDLDARLVVLSIDHAYSKEPDNAAETAAKAIFEKRGNAPRLYRNTLIFLAADKTRLQELDEAVRKFLAWKSILDEKDALDLSQHQVKQGRDPENGCRWCGGHRSTGNVPVAARADTGDAASACELAGNPLFIRTGLTCGSGQQEAEKQ
jgi:hypothetical protein